MSRPRAAPQRRRSRCSRRRNSPRASRAPWKRTVGADIAALAIVVVALIDLARYTVYILVFVVIVQAVMSWINPDAPLAPVFDALARPFLRPLRRFVPSIGAVDLTPLILLVILQVLLIPINYLRIAAGGLS